MDSLCCENYTAAGLLLLLLLVCMYSVHITFALIICLHILLYLLLVSVFVASVDPARDDTWQHECTACTVLRCPSHHHISREPRDASSILRHMTAVPLWPRLSNLRFRRESPSFFYFTVQRPLAFMYTLQYCCKVVPHFIWRQRYTVFDSGLVPIL